METEIGGIYTGKVTGITNFGAFVELEPHVVGMVHISEVAETYVRDINDHLKIGQEVRVKVLTVGENGKLGLSIRKAVPTPAPMPKPAAHAETAPTDPFEAMLSKFKKSSEEKISDLRRGTEAKHGSYGKKR